MDTGTRCRTLEDVQAIIKSPFDEMNVFNHRIRMYVENDGVASVNPEYRSAPFALYVMIHPDGRKWLAGIRL